MSSSSATSVDTSAEALARRLALDPPVGNAEVDRLITTYQKSITSTERADVWILLGRAWIRKARETSDPGFYLNAQGCADVVLAAAPDDALALGLRAQVLLNQHRFLEAYELAGQILSKRPDDLVALAVLSDAELERGRFDESAAAAQHYMDLKPSLPAYIRASYLRWLKGDVIGAKQAAKSALDASNDTRDPEPNAWAAVQAGHLFWHEGDLKSADSIYDRALARVPEYPPALVGKGRVAMAKGDAATAVKHLKRALELSPLAETAWLLGDALTLAGDAAGADAAYQRVLKIGRSSDGRTLAAFLADKNRDIPEALAAIEKERKERGDILTDDAYAWALYRAGRLPEAKVASDHALRLGTPDMTLVYHAGAIAMALGKKAEGEKLVKKALATNPNFDMTGAIEAVALLGGNAPGVKPAPSKLRCWDHATGRFAAMRTNSPAALVSRRIRRAV